MTTYFFSPPVDANAVPPVLPDTTGPALKLFSNYRNRPAGINVYILSDNTVTTVDPDGVNAVWRYGAQSGDYPNAPYVTHAFLGGHDGEFITLAESNLLVAAGYTVTIT